MIPSAQNEFDRSAGALDAEKTLRLIAALPAPQGLEDRVKEGLHAAPRSAMVISWPFSVDGGRWMQSAGMRAAAAAVIVMVIAGGGWGIYSHIQIAPSPAAVAAPQPINGGGTFNAAGAKRVPQTLQGPVVVTPAIAKEKQEPGKAVAIPQKHHRPVAKKSAAPIPAVR